MRRTIGIALGQNARSLGTLRFDAQGSRENAAIEYDAAEWLAALHDLCRTPQQRAAAVDGALIQLRLRWTMYDAIAARITP